MAAASATQAPVKIVWHLPANQQQHARQVFSHLLARNVPVLENVARIMALFVTHSDRRQDLVTASRLTLSFDNALKIPWKSTVVFAPGGEALAQQPQPVNPKCVIIQACDCQVESDAAPCAQHGGLVVSGAIAKIINNIDRLVVLKPSTSTLVETWIGPSQVERAAQPDDPAGEQFKQRMEPISLFAPLYWLILEIFGNPARPSATAMLANNSASPPFLPSIQPNSITSWKQSLSEVFINDVVVKQIESQALRAFSLPAKNKLRSPSRGILLYGPPGTGKTQICNHLIATVGFRTIFYDSSVVMNQQYIGETEKQIERLFQVASLLPNVPAIIGFEEVDTIASSRNRSSMASHEVNWLGLLLTRLTDPAFANVFMLCNTNRLSAIDGAFIRQGRVSTLIYIGRPSVEDRWRLLLRALNDKGLTGLHNTLQAISAADRALFDALLFNFTGAQLKGAVDAFVNQYILAAPAGNQPDKRQLAEAIEAFALASDDPDLVRHKGDPTLLQRIPLDPGLRTELVGPDRANFTGLFLADLPTFTLYHLKSNKTTSPFALPSAFRRLKPAQFAALAFANWLKPQTTVILDSRRTQLLHQHEETPAFTGFIEECRQAGRMGGCVVAIDLDDIAAPIREEAKQGDHQSITDRLLRDAAFSRIVSGALHMAFLNDASSYCVVVVLCSSPYVTARAAHAWGLKHFQDGSKPIYEAFVPDIVPLVYGNRLKCHSVTWSASKKHAELAVLGGGFSVKCNGTAACHRVIYGTPSGSPEGWTTGIHYYSVRVLEPGPNAYVMIGMSDGTLSLTTSTYPGCGINSGAALYIANGHVYYSGTNSAYTPAGQKCSVGVLVDLELLQVTFFMNGSNDQANGPFASYQIPPGKTWWPCVTLYQQNSFIASEICDISEFSRQRFLSPLAPTNMNPINPALHHTITWDSARKHKELAVLSDGRVVRCESSSACHRVIYGTPSGSPLGWTAGIHYYSIRVVEPGPNAYVMIGVSDGTLSLTTSAYPGHAQDSGASFYVSNGYVYYRGTHSAYSSGAQRCTVGVLVDLTPAQMSLTFFVNGTTPGAFASFKLPAGKNWWPCVTLYQKNSLIASEEVLQLPN